MHVLEAIPQDVMLVVQISLKDMRHMKTIMDNMTFNMDGSKPSHVAASKYLHEVWYPVVADTVKEFEHQPEPPVKE